MTGISIKSIFLESFLMFAFLSCTTSSAQQGKTQKPDLEQIVVSRICTSDSGKPYLEVDGNPFPVYGAQIRLDVFRSVDKLDWASIDEYFALAENLGVNTIQVPCPWAFIEPKQDKWDFTCVDKTMEFALKHNLKVELLWFSTNFIGDSYSWLCPTYILAMSSVRLKRNSDGDYHGLYGYTYSIDFADDAVLEREVNAVTKLFEHIRSWDADNGNTHPIITCQVHNEPDALVRWRIDEKQIAHKDGTLLTKSEGWKMTLRALDIVGNAVKNSAYSVATRTNIISGDGVNDFPQTPGISPKDVYALDGIDFVSYDPYMSTVNQIAYEVSQYASLKGNYPLVAENRGDYSNTPSLILTASALGGGYDIYDLATSKYISSNSAAPWNSEGIYYSDLTPKPQVAQTSLLLDGLIAAGEDVALTSTADFAAFNIKTDSPQTALSQTINTTCAKLTFETSSGALAFVLDRGDCLVAYATKDGVLTVANGTLLSEPKNTVSITGGKLYRLSFKSDGSLNSTTKSNIGTIFNNTKNYEKSL